MSKPIPPERIAKLRHSFERLFRHRKYAIFAGALMLFGGMMQMIRGAFKSELREIVEGLYLAAVGGMWVSHMVLIRGFNDVLRYYKDIQQPPETLDSCVEKN